MTRPTGLYCAVAVAAMLLPAAASLPSAACGFHAPLGNGLLAKHPRSFSVAFAVRDAIDAGLIGGEAAAPLAAGNAAYWQAVSRLDIFAARLRGGLSETRPVFVYLVDADLWAQLRLDGSRVTLAAHTEPAGAGEAVILTTDAVLGLIISKVVSIETALERGLVVIDAAGPAKRLLEQVIVVDPAPSAEITRLMFGRARAQNSATAQINGGEIQ